MQRINAKVRDDLPLTHEEHEAWRRWIGIAPASSSSSSAGKKRKRKKRKKRKLPRAPLPRCGRPRAVQRQVPAVHCRVLHGAPASVHRQSGGHCCLRAETCTHSANCAEGRRSCRCCSWTVPPPGVGGVGFGSSPYLDTKHTFYELCLPSERGYVELSCGGGFYSWWCLRFGLGHGEADDWKYFVNYFQYQEFVVCICMLNYWFSSNDEFCADNYFYFRFTLQACVAVGSGSCISTAIRPSRWTVIACICCPGVCLASALHPFRQRITPSFCCACLSVAWV